MSIWTKDESFSNATAAASEARDACKRAVEAFANLDGALHDEIAERLDIFEAEIRVVLRDARRDAIGQEDRCDACNCEDETLREHPTGKRLCSGCFGMESE